MAVQRLLALVLAMFALLAVGCLMPTGQHPVELEIKDAPGGLIARPLRPRGSKDIRFIMLHAMSDAAANPDDPFQLDRIQYIFESYEVEAHYVIDREGQIFRFVADNRTARHAGRGSWNGDPELTNNMNRYAIGIELMGIGSSAEMEPVIGAAADALVRSEDRGYTQTQYLALNMLLGYLMNRYSVPPENILTHKDYDPQRKWDPGELFDWDKLSL